MSQTAHLGLFEGYGLELEYMIVDRQSLAVRPLSDKVLSEMAGEVVCEVSLGETAWSNELVMHVIELKTDGPKASLMPLAELFANDVRRINDILKSYDAMLLPTAMHPFMVPDLETKLWPHDAATIYEAYDRIFSCKGHGWSNLQSVHINLPFRNQSEFGRLHAAIRLVLPLLPGLAASSPLQEGRLSGFLDTRLEHYRQNQKRLPMITGQVIPEQAFSFEAYQDLILQPIYDAIRPFDPEGELAYEWLNSRGAIARFNRNAIEIRVLDIQECPRADMAIAGLVVATLKALVAEKWCLYESQMTWSENLLAPIFRSSLKTGGETVIDTADYAALFGYQGKASVKDLWLHIMQELLDDNAPDLLPFEHDIKLILSEGTLAQRIMRALDGSVAAEDLKKVYRELANCLATNRLFLG